MTNNFAFDFKVDLCLKYTFTSGGWPDKSIIMLISAPVGFELGLRAELGNKLVIKLRFTEVWDIVLGWIYYLNSKIINLQASHSGRDFLAKD